MSAIDFYFDFSSPYGYLAAEQIDALAARFGRQVNWQPVLLGVIFKATGNVLGANPAKWQYALNDFARSARFYDLPYRQPATFPIATQQAGRAFYWLKQQDPAAAKQLAQALYRAFFVEGQNISDAEVVLAIAAGLGHDRAALSAALADDAIKATLKDATEAAIARQVFGSPFFIVDGEHFFGADRLPQLEKFLAEAAKSDGAT